METGESNLLRRQETDSRKKFPGQLWVRGFTGALGWRCEKQGGDRVAAATEVGRHRHRVLLELGRASVAWRAGGNSFRGYLGYFKQAGRPQTRGAAGGGGCV